MTFAVTFRIGEGMDLVDGLRVLVASVETGSFSGAAGRLGAGLAGFALGRVMATAAPGEKEICMKSGCSA